MGMTAWSYLINMQQDRKHMKQFHPYLDPKLKHGSWVFKWPFVILEATKHLTYPIVSIHALIHANNLDLEKGFSKMCISEKIAREANSWSHLHQISPPSSSSSGRERSGGGERETSNSVMNRFFSFLMTVPHLKFLLLSLTGRFLTN